MILSNVFFISIAQLGYYYKGDFIKLVPEKGKQLI